MNDLCQSHPQTNLGVILITAGSPEEATDLAERLVVSQLAACVNILPVQSVYSWQGKLQRDSEWQLIVKTDLGHFQAIAQLMADHHSYELPEVIALPIVQGSAPYLQWMETQITRAKPD